MSYQFKDESALEDLLNKQLVGRRKAPLGRPSTAAAAAEPQQTQAEFAGSKLLERPAQQSAAGLPARGKLSSWLEGKVQAASAGKPAAPSSGADAQQVAATADTPYGLPEAEGGRDDDVHAATSNDKLRSNQREQAQAEKRENELLEAKHANLIELERQKWTQLSKQLEARLELSQRELANSFNEKQETISKLNEDFEKNLKMISGNYERKLDCQRREFEAEVKRRDELHKVELESKLRVECTLDKLNSVQREWQQIVEATAGQLRSHLNSMESLMEKQELQVSSTNLELIEKTKRLCEQHSKFEASNEKSSQLLAQLSDCFLPKFSTIHKEAERILSQLGDQLKAFDAQQKFLCDKQQKVEFKSEELNKFEAKLNERRFNLELEQEKMLLKEERLNELLKSNKSVESSLSEKQTRLDELASQLEGKRVNLDFKGNELREQNYQLHLQRTKLTKQRDELKQIEADLAKREATVQRKLVELEERSAKLESLRSQLNKELDQLGRLQNSLVCSLCLERLFSACGDVDRNKLVAKLTAPSDTERPKEKLAQPAADTEVGANLFGQLLATRGCIHLAGGNVSTAAKLAKESKRRNKSEARKLAAETNYVSLLSSAG